MTLDELNNLTVAANFSETSAGSGIYEFTSSPTAALGMRA